jgi:hypothetical protein
LICIGCRFLGSSRLPLRRIIGRLLLRGAAGFLLQASASMALKQLTAAEAHSAKFTSEVIRMATFVFPQMRTTCERTIARLTTERFAAAV